MFGEGISYFGDMLELAIKGEIIQKSGSWFSYKEERLGQGREKVKKLLNENPELAGKIENEVKAFLGMTEA